MFTGIIEDVGTIAAIRKLGGRWEFTINTGLDPDSLRIGDSISVDGVCLTVVARGGSAFGADASFETLGVTTLRDKSPADLVNLERAMKADSRFGGHLVLGHVDGIGRVAGVSRAGDSIRLEIEVSPEISRYVVRKGSIAVDGVSLTVNEERDKRFVLNIIPYSQLKTTIGSKAVGDQVNIEVDIIGRYVEKLVSKEGKPGMDLDFLYQYGYIKGR